MVGKRPSRLDPGVKGIGRAGGSGEPSPRFDLPGHRREVVLSESQGDPAGVKWVGGGGEGEGVERVVEEINPRSLPVSASA